MKKSVRILGVWCAVAMLGLVSCGDGNDDEPQAELSWLASVSVGSTLTYDGENYLVTENTLSETQESTVLRSAHRAASDTVSVAEESAANLAENAAYIAQYLKKENRAQFLKEHADIQYYIALFPMTQRTVSGTKGIGSLIDKYVILDSSGTKIAEIRQKWAADFFIHSIYPEIKSNDRTKKFNEFTEEQLREYDPHDFILETYPSNPAEKKQIQYRYEYYDGADKEESEHYKRIDMDTLRFTQETHYEVVGSVAKRLWRFQRNYTTDKKDDKLYYKTAYIIDDVKVQSNFLVLNMYRNEKDTDSAVSLFELQATGDGKIGGDVQNKTYLNLVQVDYFYQQDENSPIRPIKVSSTLGEKKTNRTTISSQKKDSKYTEDFTGDVKITKQTSSDEGKNWTDGEEKTVSVADIGKNCDFMSVSEEKAPVHGTQVPASMTYYAHFAKDDDGNYPALDQYMQITCYPEYDEANGCIVYKVTKKSIDDFIETYRKDFATLAN